MRSWDIFHLSLCRQNCFFCFLVVVFLSQNGIFSNLDQVFLGLNLTRLHHCTVPTRKDQVAAQNKGGTVPIQVNQRVETPFCGLMFEPFDG